MVSNSSERIAQAEALYTSGQVAFERGNYREAVAAFEAGIQLAGGATVLGGTLQLWLMNAYAAANRYPDAIALGEKLTQHPDRDVRKQGKRVLEILRAPQLKRRADWTTPIPDLSDLETGDASAFNLSKYSNAKPGTKPLAAPASKPEDLSQINTRDNGFVWLALGVIILTLGGLWLFR